MPVLDLTIDELLTTTRSVRKRLDLTRPVEPEVIDECLELALQAPSPGSGELWHFLVVTDPTQREALARVYRKSIDSLSSEASSIPSRIQDSARYLADHLHEVPVLIVPCIEGRTENLPAMRQATIWSSIMPAVWSFMLAARSRGLGTVLTTVHLVYEREAADVLGIPYERIMQTSLLPIAYTLGTTFKPAARKPLSSVLHRDRW
jgi:nitroreductase